MDVTCFASGTIFYCMTQAVSLADEGVQLKLQFSNRELLFDFAVLLDLRYKSQWLLLSY